MILIDKSRCSSQRWLSRCNLYLLAAFIAFALILLALSPLMIQKLFFVMPRPSPEFDCDDSALLMMERLSSLGIRSTPILGNLKMTGESYQETDHIWLLVEIAGLRIPFDWGQPHFDRQHYEGFTQTYQQLLAFVEQDKISPSIPVSPSDR
ncbi:MAG: hypothetical protein Q8Q07_06130 [Dehalococcoidales bacterium]|nr:hypothetical protein [Dehalococcoidales bacterium]